MGTTSVFSYIAHPVIAAAAARKPTIEVNPSDTEVSNVVTYRLRAGAKDAFEAVWAAYLARAAA